MMGTVASQAVLREAGLLNDEASAAGPNDLIVAVAGQQDVLEAALAAAKAQLAGVAPVATAAGFRQQPPPRTIAEALAEAAPEVADRVLAVARTTGKRVVLAHRTKQPRCWISWLRIIISS